MCAFEYLCVFLYTVRALFSCVLVLCAALLCIVCDTLLCHLCAIHFGCGLLLYICVRYICVFDCVICVQYFVCYTFSVQCICVRHICVFVCHLCAIQLCTVHLCVIFCV